MRRLLALRGRLPVRLHPRRRRRRTRRTTASRAGERYARIYEINLSRCIFCGYCELACPFDAITLGNEFELAEYSRDDLIYTKDMLLEPPIKTVPVADRELYDTPEPVWKVESLTALVLASTAGDIIVWIVWVVAALALLGSGVAVVLFSNPFFSALALIGNLASLAVLYLLLVGGVRRGRPGARLRGRGRWSCSCSSSRTSAGGPTRPGPAGRALSDVAAIVASLAIVVEIVVVDRARGGRHALDARPRSAARSARPREIGELFLSDHLLAFEVTSIVLLVAAVGGVILGCGAHGATPGSAAPGRTSSRRRRDARARGSPPTSSSRSSSSRPAPSACSSAAAR